MENDGIMVREEWLAKYGHVLTEQEWREICREPIEEGCELCWFYSSEPREARPFWCHFAVLQNPKPKRLRYVTVDLNEQLASTPDVEWGFSKSDIEWDAGHLIRKKGTLLIPFLPGQVATPA